MLARDRGGPLVELERRGGGRRVVRVVEPQDPDARPVDATASRSGRKPRSAQQRELEHLLARERRAALGDRVAGRGDGDESPPTTWARWKIASLEPSVGRTSVPASSVGAEAPLDPARRSPRAAPAAPRPAGRSTSAQRAAPSASRMNGGVSSRGSPMPKSTTSTPRGQQLALGVGEAHERIRRAGRSRTGEGFIAPPRRPPAPGSSRTSAATEIASSRVCACGGSPGPKLTAGDARRRELRHRRPRLLGRHRRGRRRRSARRPAGRARPRPDGALASIRSSPWPAHSSASRASASSGVRPGA